MQVRPAQAGDVVAVLELVRELAVFEGLAHECIATEDDYRAHLFGAGRCAEALVGIEAGEIVACAIVHTSFSTFRGRPTVHLEDLVVALKARGRGLGRRMLAHVAALAQQRGAARVDWSVLDWNEAALRLYRAVGAVEMAGWKSYRLAGDDLVALARETWRVQ